jgi:hypothetical protein
VGDVHPVLALDEELPGHGIPVDLVVQVEQFDVKL